MITPTAANSYVLPYLVKVPVNSIFANNNIVKFPQSGIKQTIPRTDGSKPDQTMQVFRSNEGSFDTGTYAHDAGLSPTFLGFEITTEDGTVYTFGGNTDAIQYSVPFFAQATSHWTADAWNLTKITSPDGEEIKFQYDPNVEPSAKLANPLALNFINSMWLSRNEIIGKACSTGLCQGSEPLDLPFASDQPMGFYDGSLMRPTYLKGIITRSEVIAFSKKMSTELKFDYSVYEKFYDAYYNDLNLSYTANFIKGTPPILQNTIFSDLSKRFSWAPYLDNRYDSNTATGFPRTASTNKAIIEQWTDRMTFYKMDGVKVYKRLPTYTEGDWSGVGLEERSSYKLNYNNDLQTYPSIFNERLTLNSISKESGSVRQTHSIEYQPMGSIPNIYLPIEGKVDHWGFFNNISASASDNIKTTDAGAFNTNRYQETRYPASISNEVHALSGIIKSITFPTGGKTVFNFEQNKVIKGRSTNPDNYPFGTNEIAAGGLRIKTVQQLDIDNSIISLVNYKYVNNFQDASNRSSTTSSGYQYLPVKYVMQNTNLNGTTYEYANSTRSTPFTNYRSVIRILSIGLPLQTPPVSYNEVAIEERDGSYNIIKFSDWVYPNGSNHYPDEKIITERNQDFLKYDLLLTEPFIDRSYQRGQIINEASYGSDNKIVLNKEYIYDDITNPNTDFILGVKRTSIPTKSNTDVNYGLIYARLIAGMTNYGYILDAVELVSSLFFNHKIFTYSNTTIKVTNFGTAYKIYNHQYELKRDITSVYDLKDPTRATISTTTNDYNYNQFGTLGQLNEVITTLPIDQIDATNSRTTQIISKTKFASDYDSGSESCNVYAEAIFNQCMADYNDYYVCNANRNNNIILCNSALTNEVKGLSLLKSKNMVSFPIENIKNRKIITLAGAVTSVETKNLYGNISFYNVFTTNGLSVPLLTEQRSLENDYTLSVPTLSTMGGSATFTYSNRYNIKNLSIEGYDSRGNPTKITNRNGVTQNIVYDLYNYPSSQNIQNAPISGGSAVGAATYSFEHLRGLSSATDDNSKIISYTYDGFNRLKTIADNESKILKSYAYNLPFSNSDATKADKASATETTISAFSQLDDCKPVKSYCDIQATIKPFDATTSCTNGTVKLLFDSDSTTTGTGVKYSWSGPNKFKSTEQSPIISENLVKASGVYTLTVIRDQCKSSASATSEILIDCNCTYTINTNGSTTDNLTCGTDIGATIKLFANCTGCSGEIIAGQETYVTNGKFEVFEPSNPSFSSDYDKFSVNNPQLLGGVFRSFGDHSTGNGNMIVVGHSETPNLRLYYITINNLKPKTRYQVSGWLAGATDNNPNIMFFEMNGVRLPEEVSFLTSQGGIWKQLKSNWTTGDTQTSVTLAIRKRGTVGWNWIALDDISLTEAPKPEFYWTGPNDYSSTLQNPEIRNATAKNAGNYFLSVLDKNCVRSIKTKVAINCPACTQPITVITSSNSPVSAGGIIKLKSTTEDGVFLTWFGRNITALNKNLANPEIPIDWIVKDGGETETYYIEAYKNGCADNNYADVNIIKNAVPAGQLGADLALRIRREDGGTGINAGETARFCADVNNAGPNNAYDVTFRIVIPPCLDLVDLDGSGSSGSVSGPEGDYGQKQRAWYNSTTRELSNMCTANPNQTPPYRNAGDCWMFRGAEMGGDWSWNGWNRPSPADLLNFSPRTFTKSMCFNLQATQKAKFIIKGEVMSSRGQGYQEIIDPDSFTGDGIENGQDDRAELILNDSYDILTVSKERFAVGNKSVPTQTFTVSTKVSSWSITLLGTNTSWVTVTPMSATGSNGTLKTTNVQFTVADNTSAFSRYLTIVVKSTCGDEKRINVKQAGSIECPAGLVATATTPVVCGSTINLGATIRPLQEVNIIDNPDFESGNVGFSGEAWTYYNGTSGTKAYVVDANPKSIMWFTKSSCPGTGDVNSGSGKMMGVSGSYTLNGFFWSQTVNVDRGTDYDLSVKAVQLGTYDNSGIILEYYVNGTPTGVKGTISTIGCTWGNITGKWYSGEFFGPVTLSLRMVNPTNGEKMFAIDDLSLKLSKNGRVSDEAAPSYSWIGPGADAPRLKPASGFTSSIQNPTIPNADYKHDGVYTVTATRSGCSVTSSTAVIINCPSNVCVAPSIVMTPANGVVCGNLNQTVSLAVNGCSGTILWTDNPITGISQNPRTISQTTIGTYNYKARCVSNCGMSPESAPATITVKGIPIAPILANPGPIKICPGNSITVSATCPTATTTTWTSSFPSSNSTGNNYTLTDGTNINASTPVTLTVTCVDACGTSTAKTINATVENFLAAVKPSRAVDKPRLCLGGGNVSLSATGCPLNTTYTWYKVGQAASIGTGTPLTVTVTTNASFKVRCEQQTCLSIFSDDIPVDIRTTIPATPSTPTLASGQPSSICQNTPITISASACSEAGNTLVWSTTDENVSSISWQKAISGLYDISVKCKSDIGCLSNSSGNLPITVVGGPPAPTEPCLSDDPGCESTTICKSSGVTIYGGACASGTTSAWYSSINNAAFIEMTGFTTSNIYVTPSQTTKYKVACKNSCATGSFALRTVTVNIVEKPATQVIVSPGADMTSPTCGGVSIYATEQTCKGSGFSFKWYNYGTIIPGATSWNYNATSSGSYTARCINSNNPLSCQEGNLSSARVVIIENSPSTPTLTTSTASGCNSILLTASNCGTGLTYKWYNVNDVIIGATARTYTANTSSTYSVKCVNNSNTFCKESGRSDGVEVTVTGACTYSLTINVKDAGGTALSGVSVSFNGLNPQTTNASGQIVVTGISSGTKYILYATKTGYADERYTITITDNATVDLTMSAGSTGQKGDITATLVWDTNTDLDLYMATPNGTISYGNPSINSPSPFLATLDVDANAGCGGFVVLPLKPTENIFCNNPTVGTYTVTVRLYSRCTVTTAISYSGTVQVGNTKYPISGSFSSTEGSGTIKTIKTITIDANNNVTVNNISSPASDKLMMETISKQPLKKVD